MKTPPSKGHHRGPRRVLKSSDLPAPRRTKNGKVAMYVYLSEDLSDRIRKHPDSLSEGISKLVERLCTEALEKE